jgi:transcriptional regulator
MYLPKHFEQTDPQALQALMLAHPLATLVTTAADGVTADHLPLEFDAATQTLRGHVARANPLWKHAHGQPVLAVFGGAQAYISPNWYPSKAEHHKVVPTWNYTVVHAHGTLQAVEDAPWLHQLVSRLSDHHETSQPKPWAVADAPDDYIQQMLRAIVGISIPVSRLVGKWKISQNHSAPNRISVSKALVQGTPDQSAMGRLMGTLDAAKTGSEKV